MHKEEEDVQSEKEISSEGRIDSAVLVFIHFFKVKAELIQCFCNVSK